MKIGLFFGTFAGGGAERMMIRLAIGLDQKGAEVEIYVMNKTGPSLKEIPFYIKIHDYKARYGAKSVLYRIRKTLRKNDLDVLISTQVHVNTIVALASIGLKNRPKLIFREASTPSRKYTSYWRKFIYKRFYRFADRYVAVSEGVKDDMVNYYRLKTEIIDVIYNPLIDESLKIKMNERLDHPWFNEKNNVPVIVGMGRIVPVKAFDDLIKAFALVRKETDARLVILGDMNENRVHYKYLLSLINELKLEPYVDFTGYVDNPFKYLNNASLFVLSSKSEGLPGGLVQAMACGCPVVSTDCPSGPKEILEYGRYGHMVGVGSTRKMADAILLTLKKPVAKEELINRANFFSVEKSVQKYTELIESELFCQ